MQKITNNNERSELITPKAITNNAPRSGVITNNRVLCTLITILLIIFLSISTPTAHGQTLSLGLYPPLLEVMIKPGKAITQVFNIQNFGDPLILTSGVVPFTPKDELGNVHLQTEVTPPPPQLEWFSFQNANLSLGQSFFLNTAQSQQVVLKIKIPRDAPEGDYYLSLYFVSNPQGGRLLGTQSKAKIAANILLTVSVSGKPEKKAQIVELRTPKIVDSFDKIPVVLKVKNTGTSFFKPRGEIILKGPFNLKSLFPILPENVLAASTRLLQASPSALLIKKPLESLTIQGFFLGPYKIMAKFSLDENGPPLSKETSFLALPLKLTLAFFILIVFLLLLKRKVKDNT